VMPRREVVIAWFQGFVLVGLPIWVVAVLLDWPSISFLGSILIGGLVFIARFVQIERKAGHL
jgi:hypothetical protein